MSRRLAALLAATLLATGAIGCGGGDDDGGSGDVPSGSVATIGDVEISQEDLNDQVVTLERAQRSGGSSTGGGEQDGDVSAAMRKQLEAQALAVLLQREALEQEAADRDIEVSDEEVEERWDTASQGQFKTEKALKRFLGGQTEEDLLAQLRLQVLTERIHEQVSEQAGGGKQGAKAIAKFQEDFQKRWQGRTDCAKGYTASGCSDDKSE